jgi:ribosome-binding factor A
MTIDRMTRVNELLKREIASALFRILAPEDHIDTAAVTVTHVITNRNLRHARVLVSILGHESERDAIIGHIRHHRVELQKWINHAMKLKYTPKLEFELDASVEQGDHVLQVLKALEDEQTIPPYDPIEDGEWADADDADAPAPEADDAYDDADDEEP